MIVITIFTAIILLGLLINSNNKRKNTGLFKKLGKYDYKPITGLSLEQLDNLPLNDKIILEEYKNIADILLQEFGITVYTQEDSASLLWSYSVNCIHKGDFLNSDENYSTRQEALRAAFIHVLKEWI
jgi:hypothetical protein